MLQLGIEIPFGAGSPRFVVSQGFEFEVGILMVVLAGAALALREVGTSFLAELRAVRLPGATCPPIWLLACMLLAALIGMSFLSQPMRYDEAFTALFFVDSSWPAAFYYPLPNNHFAYTVLERLMVGDSPEWLRLPAMLAWLASIAVAFQACRRLGSSGQLAAVGMSVTPFLLLYATSARGYSLTVLVTILIVWNMARARLNGVALGAFSAIGLFVMPSMLYALAGLALWGLVLAGGRWRELLPWAAFTALFTTVLYLPVLMINRVEALSANRFFARTDGFWPAALRHADETAMDFTRDVPATALVSLGLLAVVGLAMAYRERRWGLLALLPAVLAGSGVAFAAKASIPFPRTWIFLIPVVLIVADTGWTRLVGHRRWPKWCLLGVAAVFGWHLVSLDVIERYPDTGTAPDARAMAAQVASTVAGTDWICAKPPADAVLRYYLQRDFPVRMGAPARALVFYVGGAPTLPFEPVSRVGALGLYRLTEPQPVEVFARNRTCWLRGGRFFG